MKNNYNKYTTGDDLITISIDKDNPKLLYDVELNVSENDFKKVQEFIKRNYDFLDEYTKNRIGTLDLYNELK